MPEDATAILSRLESGDRSAAEDLLPLVEEELRSLARSHLRREPGGHTFQTTVLVDEAFMRLINQRAVHWRSRAHFCGLASRIIRRILVDHARQRHTAKRGGGWNRVALDDVDQPDRASIDLLALEDALTRLAEIDERQSRVVELRFFGGLGVDEAAEVLNVSPRTVEADWHMARAWLRRALD